MELRPTGLEYLALVTDLLQRERLADPVGGLWEAADLQWWYTRYQHPDPADAVFWMDGGTPVGAVVFTRWRPERYGCDVLGAPPREAAWRFIRDRCAELPGAAIEMDDSADAVATGFTEAAEEYDVTWVDAAGRAPARPFPAGYAPVARPEQDGPHPMATRNGAEVEERLRECSLYDPELDLAVRGPDGDVAAYAMFWADPRTGVGLVEPVRVEDAHAGRGVGAALLDAGLARLAARGCRRLKVSHEVGNEAARRLYHGAGFRPGQRVRVVRRPPVG